MIYEYEKDGFSISTDKSKLQFPVIHEFLRNAYWSKDVPERTVRNSISGSLCYGVYSGTEQVGFARVITDYATFAYLADVFILDSQRGKGLGKWLVECLLKNPDLAEIRGWMLKTSDAHGLYAKFGFNIAKQPEKIMELKLVQSYSID